MYGSSDVQGAGTRGTTGHEMRTIQRAGFLSIVGNVVLFGIKLAAGLTSGSIAVVADAWHTLSDSISSIVLLVGARTARKPADDDHPFGHGRAELISTVMIGTILGMIGITFALDAVERLFHHEGAHYTDFTLWVVGFSILAKEAMAQYAFAVARKTGYSSVKADGWHHRSDALSSLLLLVGILAGGRFWWMDSALALGVSVFLGYTSYSILKEAFSPLLGEAPPEELETRIQEVVRRTQPEGPDIHHLHVHHYGRHTEVTFHVVLDGETSLRKAHEIVSVIEQDLRRELGLEATIHVEPFETWKDRQLRRRARSKEPPADPGA
ncbi:cation diffusion facilitator family transporter [Spirochaeta thermophila DSM 6578]|uniref:Cation diffusion facilitator family transporter n=2 Tax=Winmispira thermophila TaxID=154 RepID=G0GC69_WINT7|nr:cation diffusion facilitator family transporter [Spirochaeta thermophila DSM 6578]